MKFWLILAACLSASTAGVQGAELRVMSFNVRYGTARDGENHWDKRKDFLVETIARFRPDLLGTQETLGFQKEYIASQLTDYEAVGVGRDRGDDQGEMTAVLFRKGRFEKLAEGHFWLSETPEVPGSKSWDTSLTRMVTWVRLRDRQSEPPAELFFFNTHFDHIGREARRQSALLIRQKIAELAGDAPTVLTGDFNAGEGTPPYQALFTEPGQIQLFDTYRIAHPERTAQEGTFSNFRESETGGARIDWIAVTGHWQVLSADIDRTARDGRTPSDHFPVTAILQRK
jgi:endonuclease/exonuclease/phosphatase family metal-dependent hydrolase